MLDAFRRKRGTTTIIQGSGVKAGSVSRAPSVSSGISTWNGCITDKYRWTQTISDLTVEIALPRGLENKKHLLVDLRSTGISVKANEATIISGDFMGKVDVSSSTWMVEDLSRVIVSLEKSKEGWWKSVLVGDQEIDLTKIESTKRIEEYDAETQGAIRKILFDENQRRQGLLTSEETIMADKLESAWNAEGSPFRGTPFDSNIVRT